MHGHETDRREVMSPKQASEVLENLLPERPPDPPFATEDPRAVTIPGSVANALIQMENTLNTVGERPDPHSRGGDSKNRWRPTRRTQIVLRNLTLATLVVVGDVAQTGGLLVYPAGQPDNTVMDLEFGPTDVVCRREVRPTIETGTIQQKDCPRWAFEGVPANYRTCVVERNVRVCPHRATPMRDPWEIVRCGAWYTHGLCGSDGGH